MKRLIAAAALTAAFVGVASPATAAYYKVTVCDVEVHKNKTVTENGTYVFTGTVLPEGDYVGNCEGYAVKTKPGNRYGITRRTA